MPPLQIYKASAGSGKTFALTMEYLRLLFRYPGIHRYILAVTFTNKAAGEMKQRILGRLSALSACGDDERMEEMDLLMKETGLDRDAVSLKAGDLLDAILNDYSGFSVGTIDKFFQSVIRAFTKDIGIQPGYNLELDHPRVLSLAVDRMFQDLGNHPDLQAWLIRFAEERMEESKSWNFRQEIIELGMQLFRESFQELFLKHDISVLSKENLDEFLRELGSLEQETRLRLAEIGKRALRQMEQQNLVPEDFNLRNNSPATLFTRAAGGQDVPFSDSKLRALEGPEKWLKKDSTPAMARLTVEQLIPLLNEVYAQQLVLNTVARVRSSFYTLGILADTWEYVRAYTRERNLFLIADSGRFLRGIIGGNQVPFIYERTGNRYQHIMLDEFQDTSQFQYDNFTPLLDNSLAAGKQDLVVGDVKQSIYRWRNSDWNILASELEKDFSHQRVQIHTLARNYRSREQIIRFNNTVFQLASEELARKIGNELSGSPLTGGEAGREVNRFREAYADVVQEIPGEKKGTGGMVKGILFGEEELNFREQVLKAIPGWVDEILNTGIEPGEIAILVRTRKEGVAVANRLLEYARQSGETNRFRLISNESLLLIHNQSVALLVSLLRYLILPEHEINNALLKYLCYLTATRPGMDLDKLFEADVQPEALFPEAFSGQKEVMRQLPLYELIETLIELFSLGTRTEDIPYLQAFQDVVIDLQRNESVGIRDFLEFWEQHGTKKGISVSEESNALRILTIHKSKGLEFKAVLIPFCDWELTTDHRNAEVLWCETVGTPLERIPVIPVKFTAGLIHTMFSPDYYRERMRGYMDSLNLLYVAFTRARDLLYIGIPPSQNQQMKTVGDLLHSLWDRSPEKEPATGRLDSFLRDGMFILGQMPEYTLTRRGEDPWQFRSYPVNRDNRSLRVRFRDDHYFVDEEGTFRTGRSYGTMMHMIFSRIGHIGDLETVLNGLQKEGQIPWREREEVETLLRRKLGAPVVRDWFSEGNATRVFNERSILCGDGTVLRPDRVIQEGKRIIVIDFKFGEMEMPSHLKQVLTYMDRLREMGYDPVDGYLWYVMLDKTVKLQA